MVSERDPSTSLRMTKNKYFAHPFGHRQDDREEQVWFEKRSFGRFAPQDDEKMRNLG
ncbi:MAG: hypothetical protein R3B41_00050 [Candidatus Doudnabacteria bacterium]